MPTLRRTSSPPRIEIMPLIDVIFLLLTFFIYAMVMLHPVRLLGIELPSLSAAESEQPAPAVNLAIEANGQVTLDRIPIEMNDVLPAIRAAVDADPRTQVYIAVDERGQTDRLPTFIALFDLLSNEGLNIKLYSRPDAAIPASPSDAAPQPAGTPEITP
jgi:biopolymer transport protein ExbD